MRRHIAVLASAVCCAPAILGQVTAPPPTITSTSPLPAATVTANYSFTFQATGGATPYTWGNFVGVFGSFSCNDPALRGLSLNTSTGVLSGTVTGTAGSANYCIAVSGSDMASSGITVFGITFNAAPSAINGTPPSGIVGSSYPATTLTVTGGTSPFTWSISSGALPTNLTIGPTTGTISGTPTASGTFNFTVQATDVNGAIITRAMSIFINPALAFATPTPLAPSTIGAPLTRDITGTGGMPQYTFSQVGGTVPPGTTFSNVLSTVSFGRLSGTPTATGTFTFLVQLCDSRPAAAPFCIQQNYSITINAALTVTTATLPQATRTGAYSTTLQATGGIPPYTWSFEGSLPSALSLSSAGVINGGIVDAAAPLGDYAFTVFVSDSEFGVASSASRDLILTVNDVPNITTTTLPNGTRTVAYSQTPAFTGGTAPRTWSVSAGSLPTGLALNSSTGQVSGTPTAAGTFNFTLRLVDANNVADTQAYTVSINDFPSITTLSLPAGTIGAAYPSQTLTGSGGQTPYLWSISAGTLPAGLTMNSAGVISGTPTGPAGTSNFTVRLQDAQSVAVTRPLSIVINDPPNITTTSLPNGTVGSVYSQSLAATGGTAPLIWSLTAGSLPAGLTMNSGGAISGTPTTVGSSSFTVQVRDFNNATDTQALSITVINALTITGITQSTVTVNSPFSGTLQATGGIPPYTWSVTSLPSGLSLNASTGVISGTPTSPGTSSFNATVTDSSGNTTSRSLSISVNPPALDITTQTVPRGVVGQAYSASFSATGGQSPYSWSLQGSAPPGLSFSSEGVLSGTATTAGSFRINVLVTDNRGSIAGRAFTVVIDAPPLTITTTSLANATLNSAYSATVAATGGQPPYTFSSAGLPGGLSMNTAGEIRGTPQAPGAFPVTVTVVDAQNNRATRDFTLNVFAALTITTGSPLPGATINTAYSTSFAAAGGRPPYRFSGSGPAGLSLSSEGNLTGTPTEIGNFSFSVEVTDSAGNRASKQFSLTVAGRLTVVTETLGTATVGVPFSATLAAAGGQPPYTWTGSAPAGLSVSSSGEVSGTPNATGTFSVSVEVTDATGARASRGVSLTVVAALTIQTTSLPNAVTNVAYSASLSATGGQPPYSWSISSGSPPDGISLSSDGSFSGTATAPGSSSFTVRVTDAANNSATRSLSITVNPPPVPGVNVTGLPPAPQPLLQPNLNVTLNNAYPFDVEATINLTFASDAGGDDQTIQFATGGRTATLTIPSGSTQAVTPVGVQVGTVAGEITLRVTMRSLNADVTPSPAPVFTIRIPRSAPTLRTARIQRTANGFEFIVVGFTTTREATTATFTLEAAPGSSLQNTTITVDVRALFTAWFQNQSANATGGQFSYRQPFQGDASAVRSVTLILANSVGNSQPISAQVP